MESKEFGWKSKYIDEELKIRKYGTGGKAVIMFPTECGRYYDMENFGIIKVAKEYLEKEKIQLYAVDSYDCQSWLNQEIKPKERAVRYDNYVRYVINEMVPFIREESGLPEDEKLMSMGISLGGYHASNFLFRFPDIFDMVISFSGKMHLEQYIGDYLDETVYFNSPMHYLKNLTDEWYLEKYRESQIIICVGHGQWEDEMIEDAMELQMLLRKKNVRSWLDFWGYDVDHNWSWWCKEWEYFLDQLFPLEQD